MGKTGSVFPITLIASGSFIIALFTWLVNESSYLLRNYSSGISVFNGAVITTGFSASSLALSTIAKATIR